MKTYAYKITSEECYEVLYNGEHFYKAVLHPKTVIYQKLRIHDEILLFVDSQFTDDYKYGYFAILTIDEMHDKVKKDYTLFERGDKTIKKYNYEKNVVICSFDKRSPYFQPLLETIEPYIFSGREYIELNFGKSTYTRKEHNDLKVIVYVRDCIYNDFAGQYRNKTVANNIAALITRFVQIPDGINYYVFIQKLLLNNKGFWYEYPKRTVRELKDLANDVLIEMRLKDYSACEPIIKKNRMY